MHPFFTTVVEKPTSHKVGFWVGSLLLVIGIFWQFFYKDLSAKKVELDTKIEQLNSSIVTELRIAKNLDLYRREVKSLEEKLALALMELPNLREIPDLLSSISDLARKAGLEVSLFKSMPEVRKEFYAEVPVAINVAGTFHQVSSFFDEVAQHTRIININQITLKEPKVTDSQVNLKAECIATTFRYIEESERVKTPEKGQNKRRRK